jgi:hypothetical protein
MPSHLEGRAMADRDNEDLEIVVRPLEEIQLRERQKNPVREKIAMRLTYAIVAISLTPILGAAIFPEKATAIRDVAVSIIPAVVGIYGTIIGFYFGENK